ncbi:prephenate dehydrogenase (NADP(+)) [Psilocybe cubensis]|uniref:Prephenate dehydrogenase (NADP(+)) n=2 Tax=Psilocybe cubensis TaxID=181762 RepID=A0ACB8GMA1_PSICU|nr:prephenate dehydrogenase (NADP(+)) [Psilocybe cubensis]KAH9476336.1 prephenate dehydrogenase (NADP(+)) [Psilocybe cubensis]
MSRIVITGVTGGSPNRLEINDFVKNEKFFSLYIQALQIMASGTSQSDFQSFFQIGGIHGLPNKPWDGAVGSQPWDPNTQWGGYCTHGSVLFPTWHRPYVMLYEQIMQKHAAEVAAKYTVDTASWVEAAANIRQPYWDWAANAVPPDQVIAMKQVTITGPNGNKITVDNPLYHYKFNPIDSSFPRPYSRWPTTLRQPTSTRPDATDNVTRLKNVLRAAQSDITMSTYSMLTRVHTWTAFSNHTVGDGGSTSNSLEAIHDGIHVDVGGNGQMADPSVAAFDPIFFLHHCNVDRLLSLWSALNPGVWVSKGDSEFGSFTMPPEIPVDETTPLTPFWDSQTSFWASSSTQDTTKLGYTYPEFNGLDMGNASAVKTAIGNIVNRLYGTSVFGSFAAAAPSSFGTTAAFAIPASLPAPEQSPPATAEKATEQHVLSAPSASRDIKEAESGHGPALHTHHIIPPSQGLYDWTARIECKKYEIGTSFSVLIFLGTVPEDPNDWLVDPHFVGAHHAFVNSSAGECANCRNQSDLVIEGFVHLNRAIVKHSGLSSLAPDAVVPYLSKELHFRAQKVNGEVVELQSLEVSVFGTPLTYPPGAIFPVAGTPKRYGGITYGRPGGSRHA